MENIALCPKCKICPECLKENINTFIKILDMNVLLDTFDEAERKIITTKLKSIEELTVANVLQTIEKIEEKIPDKD